MSTAPSSSPASPRPAALPDALGHFGPFGGKFVPETLMAALSQLEDEYAKVRDDPAFQRELADLLRDYVGRPTPLFEAKRLAAKLGAPCRIFLKREDLAHTGAHKINNTLGQALLAKRLGKNRIIAETGAGQHGVATATAAALLGLECEGLHGRRRRPPPGTQRLPHEPARREGQPRQSGTRTLKDATNEAMRDWMATVDTTHYIIGSVVGPIPSP
jgi:tryptophan synthase beta chain